jgi:hypothetical protein
MNKIPRYISILLIVSFLPVIIPREFVHNLFGHDDTCDFYHAAKTIEKAHTHCSILQITFSTFISSLKNFLPQNEVTGSDYTFSCRSSIPGISVHLSALRAPPAPIL